MKPIFTIIAIIIVGTCVARGLSEIAVMYKTSVDGVPLTEYADFTNKMEKFNTMSPEEIKLKLSREITNQGW